MEATTTKTAERKICQSGQAKDSTHAKHKARLEQSKKHCNHGAGRKGGEGVKDRSHLRAQLGRRAKGPASQEGKLDVIGVQAKD